MLLPPGWGSRLLTAVLGMSATMVSRSWPSWASDRSSTAVRAAASGRCRSAEQRHRRQTATCALASVTRRRTLSGCGWARREASRPRGWRRCCSASWPSRSVAANAWWVGTGNSRVPSAERTRGRRIRTRRPPRVTWPGSVPCRTAVRSGCGGPWRRPAGRRRRPATSAAPAGPCPPPARAGPPGRHRQARCGGYPSARRSPSGRVSWRMPDTYHTAGLRRGPPLQVLQRPGQPLNPSSSDTLLRRCPQGGHSPVRPPSRVSPARSRETGYPARSGLATIDAHVKQPPVSCAPS